jgi:lysophospholipase L1-like esterase
MRIELLGVLLLTAAVDTFGGSPKVPEARPPSEKEWHRLTKYQHDQLTVRRADICLLGDSLTEFWAAHGKAAWEGIFGKWRTVNCGIAGDRVENISFRAERLDFARSKPRVIVLLAGTNNLGAEPPNAPTEVAEGITALAGKIRALSPETHLVLLSIPPSGVEPGSALRTSIRAANKELGRFAAESGIGFLDTYPLFVDEQDRWRTGATLDGTHFSPAGYGVMAAALKPVLEPLLAPVAK